MESRLSSGGTPRRDAAERKSGEGEEVGDWLTAGSQLGFYGLLHSCMYYLYATDPEIYCIYFCLTPFVCEYNTILMNNDAIYELEYL